MRVLRRNDGFPSGELGGGQREVGAGGCVPVPGGVQRLAGDDLAALDQLDQELPVGQRVRHRPGADHLGLGVPVRVQAPRGPLAAADRRLAAAGLLGHRHQRRPLLAGLGAGDQLVDHRGRRVPGAGHQLGADAVRVHGRRRQRGDGVLVQVRGDHDLRLGGPQLVELLAHPVGDQQQVAGVDAHRAQLGPGDLDGRTDGLGDVVGVDQQRGVPAQGVHLGAEGVALVVVQQGEGVGGGADGGDVVAEAGGQVGGGREAAHVGRAGGGDGGQLVGAAGAHLDQRPVAGGRGHAGGGGRDRRVVVEDGQDHRLQQHALAEGALHPHDRRAREVHLALGIAPDVPAEAVLGEPVQGLLVDDAPFAQEAQDARVEAEVLHRVQHPAGARHDAVPAAVGQAPGEDLEHAPPPGRTGLQRGSEHGQLVLVREERRRGDVHRQPKVRCVHTTDRTPISSV
ncbi:hypothetical protein STENM36S_05672 [Streptomyces tendae]